MDKINNKIKYTLIGIIMTGFLVIVFTGCTSCAPSGFLRSGAPPPIIYNGNWVGSLILWTQFPELNSPESWDETGRHFISFNGEIYSLKVETTLSATDGLQIGVIVFREDEKIGQFVDIPEEWRTGSKHVSFSRIFLYENYLYYNLTRWRTEFFLFAHAFMETYTREEFYRFNLNTYENEEIRLTQFVEALQTIDSNWAINPDYKGER